MTRRQPSRRVALDAVTEGIELVRHRHPDVTRRLRHLPAMIVRIAPRFAALRFADLIAVEIVAVRPRAIARHAIPARCHVPRSRAIPRRIVAQRLPVRARHLAQFVVRETLADAVFGLLRQPIIEVVLIRWICRVNRLDWNRAVLDAQFNSTASSQCS